MWKKRKLPKWGIPEGFNELSFFNRCLTSKEIWQLFKWGAIPIDFWSFTARYNLAKGMRILK